MSRVHHRPLSKSERRQALQAAGCVRVRSDDGSEWWTRPGDADRRYSLRSAYRAQFGGQPGLPR